MRGLGPDCDELLLAARSVEPAKRGVAPGGIVLAIIHITEPGEEPTYKRLLPGELWDYFTGWEILHSYEGRPTDLAHQRAVAEIVARRPMSVTL